MKFSFDWNNRATIPLEEFLNNEDVYNDPPMTETTQKNLETLLHGIKKYDQKFYPTEEAQELDIINVEQNTDALIASIKKNNQPIDDEILESIKQELLKIKETTRDNINSEIKRILSSKL